LRAIRVLIVEDNAVNQMLTRLLLSEKGHEVRTAADAEQALEILKVFHPALILVDLHLPGMDGLELTRILRKSEPANGPLILALTASSASEDEQRALAAGCDGFIAKPIDARTFCATIERFFGDRKSDVAATPSFADLARGFLASGAERSFEFLRTLPPAGDWAELRSALHQWAGLGGTFGHPEITRISREIERLFEAGGVSPLALQAGLSELTSVFAVALRNELEQPALPLGVADRLSGKRVALVGFDEPGSRRISALLESTGSFSRIVADGNSSLAGFDLAIVNAVAFENSLASGPRPPTLVIGPRAVLMQMRPVSDKGAQDFLFEPWDAIEVVIRASLLLRGHGTADAVPSDGGVKSVVIADDDPTTIALLRATLQNYGFTCITATNGGHALELMRSGTPRAAILDVNMPNMDGFEVLAAARQDPKASAIRVILLTARQQESDILRGFGLGADDYVVKPFSPMELTARLKRLLS
jgi:two-component system cell cycle response regulator DivK